MRLLCQYAELWRIGDGDAEVVLIDVEHGVPRTHCPDQTISARDAPALNRSGVCEDDVESRVDAESQQSHRILSKRHRRQSCTPSCHSDRLKMMKGKCGPGRAGSEAYPQDGVVHLTDVDSHAEPMELPHLRRIPQPHTDPPPTQQSNDPTGERSSSMVGT